MKQWLCTVVVLLLLALAFPSFSEPQVTLPPSPSPTPQPYFANYPPIQISAEPEPPKDDDNRWLLYGTAADEVTIYVRGGMMGIALSLVNQNDKHFEVSLTDDNRLEGLDKLKNGRYTLQAYDPIAMEVAPQYQEFVIDRSKTMGESQEDQLLFFLVLFPLLSVGGIALIWIGLSGIRKAREQEERERARASATVVDRVKHTSLRRGKPSTWHPVVEFAVDGQTHRHESHTGYWLDQFEVGERVEILYDADDPSCFHLEKLFDREITGDKITVIVGILWILVAGVVAFFVSR